MESKLIPTRILCSTHPEEVIIRVSVDPHDEKLFYCQLCLENPKPNLIKYQDLLQHLTMQFQSQSTDEVALPPQITGFTKDQKQFEEEVTEQVSREKQRIDEGLRKIEKQLSQLVKKLSEVTGTRLEALENSLKKFWEENSYSEESSSREVPSKQELQERIIGSTIDPNEVRDNLRTVLGELEAKKVSCKEINPEEISKLKGSLERILANTFVIPMKDEKVYKERLKMLEKLLEALLFSVKVDVKLPDDSDSLETLKHMKYSKSIQGEVDKLNKEIEKKSQALSRTLDAKFELSFEKPKCLGEETGYTCVEGEAFRCRTCYQGLSGAYESDYICKSCKDCCHKGHEVESVGVVSYYCMCQWTMPDCQLSTRCLYKFTGSSSWRMAIFKCNVCEMSSSRVLCTYCAKRCHKEHGTTHSGISSTYCDCPGLFSFCEGNKQNQSG